MGLEVVELFLKTKEHVVVVAALLLWLLCCCGYSVGVATVAALIL